MQITLYRFDKRPNSTLQPDSNTVSTSLECKLLDLTSVVNPTVILQNTDPNIAYQSFTYAYIPSFNRYYFITNITSSRNLWVITMSVDVLASYRHDIRNSSQYVLRSSIQYNTYEIDRLCHSIANGIYAHPTPTSNVQNFSSSTLEPLQSDQYEIHRRSVMLDGSWSVDRTYFAQGLTSGGYIVGVVSDNGTGNTYYAMTRSSLVTFLNKVLTLTPSDFTDTSSGVARALVNGIQYITSIRWYPAIPSIPGSRNPETEIRIGGYGVDVNGLSIYNICDNYIEEFYFDLTIPTHPMTVTQEYGRIDWVNLSPYTQYNLYFAPFGNIPLDNMKLLDATSLRVNWTIDFITGNAILKLKKNPYERLFYTSTSNLGVELPVSSLVVKNLAGLGLITAYTALKGADSRWHTTGIDEWIQNNLPGINGITQPFKDLTQSVMSAVGFEKTGTGVGLSEAIDMGVDAVASCIGQVQTNGNPDSFLAYYEMPVLYAWFLDVTFPDFERFGRPLNKSISKLSYIWNGFCQCADSNVSFDDLLPTLPERNKVNSMLNTGVYLE